MPSANTIDNRPTMHSGALFRRGPRDRNAGSIKKVNFPQMQTTQYYPSAFSGGPLHAYQDGVLGNFGLLRSYKDGVLGSLGRVVMNTTPIVAAAKMARGASGLGDETPPEPEVPPPVADSGWSDLGFIAFGMICVMGALSYQAGKAMSPNRAQARTWGLIGIPVGLFTGPWGLGVMGIVSNSKKG